MKIRSRLLLTVGLFSIVAAVAIDLSGSLLIDRAVSNRAIERLILESDYLSFQLEHRWPDDAPAADAWCDEAGEALHVRVTLLDAGGRVLGDSAVAARDISAMENHRGRPEVVQAAAEGVGTASRLSASVGREFEYVARRVGGSADPLGYVRLSAPTVDLRAASQGYRLTLTLISIGLLIVLAGFAYALVRRFDRPIAHLARAADLASTGGDTASISWDADDEFGRLAAAVDRMRRSLRGRLDASDSRRRLLESMVVGLREGILAVDNEKRVVLFNPALGRAFDIGPEVVPGSPMIMISWDHAIVEAFEEALAGAADVRRRIALAGGRALEITVVPFTDASGAQAGAIGLFFDVTRLEALERVRREFVADLSHELRTPLASIRAAVETLCGGALSDGAEAARFLEIVAKNGFRMEAILNDLTDLSSIETGSINLSPVRVDLATAVREAVSAIAAKAAARGVTIDTDIEPGLSLKADRRRLDQILLNLLDNAVKFNRPDGSVIVSARLSGGMILLQVEDTGDGIPPDALHRVFHRFFRVDRARSRDVAGTGLGLAIVSHLVRLHGGRIRVENRDEGGARFVVEMPAKPAPC